MSYKSDYCKNYLITHENLSMHKEIKKDNKRKLLIFFHYATTTIIIITINNVLQIFLFNFNLKLIR